MESIELNDLPRYNGWIAELLGGERQKRIKNPEQISREFGLEKWGALLSKWQEQPCGVDTVRHWECAPETRLAVWLDGKPALMSAAEAHEHYLNVIEDALLDSPADHLIEIGCGYGSILFGLLQRGRIRYDSVLGLEYTPQGEEMARCLANWHGYDATIGHGDFCMETITDQETLPGSDIFTSFSFHYLHDSRSALDNLIRLRPKRVIHFEPILQHYDEQTISGLLQRKYLEINDYNASLRTELGNLESAGKVEIIKESPLIFGKNFLLPASMVAWRPTFSSTSSSQIHE